MDNHHNYAKRNAIAAALTSIVKSYVPVEDRTVKSGFDLNVEQERVRTGDWMFGVFIDVTGLTKTTEKRIVRTMALLMPSLRVKTYRKTIYQPRIVEFSF